ncbi:histidine ammonia-lyase [Promethearchaeum syntrophicum]|uniref:Histidine ammonia-lyase n=1 Tax=Promethearchaeum syntrophicum TaxID=2594042 RepID=A0A5B9D5V4_9ARCH|nr:histidine ammonia-lyase [Candidatus Prometheoarchaeum syntrophicum]QEE14200.1 histidine ammonia-lyase [Candidatus Prometheoarchaeum syntrophicum]
MTEIFRLGIDHLTPLLATKIARGEIKGVLTEESIKRVNECHATVNKIAKGIDPVYAINTGFGSLCTTKISYEDAGKLQENLLKSHSVGVGDPIENEIAKLMLILKVHALCQGYSGASIGLIERIIWHIDNNIIPKVPEQGSVGASGDLCPLAHLFLPLIGLGELSIDGGRTYTTTEKLLQEKNMAKFSLGAKEGLALINGTQFMAAHGIKIVERLKNCQDHADIIAAISLEGFLGSKAPFDKRLHEIRPHPGAQIVAERIRKLLNKSELIESHKDCNRVQDPYSFRCIPQVHGASRDALVHLEDILTIEINSVTDNPNIFITDGIPVAISGGGFHGEPIALPLDYAGLAASELGNISDRRIYLLLGEKGDYGLPDYLIEESGLNSGFMITQYLTAALVSENKSLCFPASADSIPTSNGVEDIVSMGSISARKTLKIIDNLEKILGVELFCACQAIDFRQPLKSSPILEKCLKYVRTKIPHIKNDEVLSKYIETAIEIVRGQQLLIFFNE